MVHFSPQSVLQFLFFLLFISFSFSVFLVQNQGSKCTLLPLIEKIVHSHDWKRPRTKFHRPHFLCNVTNLYCLYKNLMVSTLPLSGCSRLFQSRKMSLSNAQRI